MVLLLRTVQWLSRFPQSEDEVLITGRALSDQTSMVSIASSLTILASFELLLYSTAVTLVLVLLSRLGVIPPQCLLTCSSLASSRSFLQCHILLQTLPK